MKNHCRNGSAPDNESDYIGQAGETGNLRLRSQALPTLPPPSRMWQGPLLLSKTRGSSSPLQVHPMSAFSPAAASRRCRMTGSWGSEAASSATSYYLLTRGKRYWSASSLFFFLSFFPRLERSWFFTRRLFPCHLLSLPLPHFSVVVAKRERKNPNKNSESRGVGSGISRVALPPGTRVGGGGGLGSRSVEPSDSSSFSAPLVVAHVREDWLSINITATRFVEVGGGPSSLPRRKKKRVFPPPPSVSGLLSALGGGGAAKGELRADLPCGKDRLSLQNFV